MNIKIFKTLSNPRDLFFYSASLVLLAIFALGVLASVLAYQTVTGNEVYTNTISVQGRGEVDATPDIAMIYVSFEETNTEAEKATNDINENVANFVKEIQDEINIEDKDIKTRNYSLSPKYELVEVGENMKRPNPYNREQVGFVASQQVEVKVRDSENVAAVLAAASNSEPQNISGPNYQIDDDIDYSEQALEKAIEQAREKAQNRAKILKVSLGDLIDYREDGVYGGPVAYSARADFAIAEVSSANDFAQPKIMPGQETVTRTVTLEYEIK